MSMACLANRWVGLLPWQRTWENETLLNSPHNSCMHETSESTDKEDDTSLDNAFSMMMDSDGITFQNRGGARNFYLRGPSCSTNIFIKTTSHIHIYTCFFIIYTFFYLISYIYIYIYTHTKKKKKSLVFSIKIMFDGNFS